MYRVANMAGGTEGRTDNLEEAVLAALTLPMVGQVYRTEDGRDAELVDLSAWELEYDADGNPYLVDA
jgi:hypothetical protein